MKRTLKRGLKVREIAEREAIGPNVTGGPGRQMSTSVLRAGHRSLGGAASAGLTSGARRARV